MLSYLVIDDPSGAHFRDLDPRLPVERKRYLKSCWFDAQVPADVWHYLINGSIYDPRHDNLGQKSVKCQQCAYAWWTYFHFLHHQTQKPVYRLLRDEIAFTVLLDQDVDGGWRHGCWYEEMETHARFFLDGIHLLLSQYEESGQPRWLNAASEAMDGFLKCMGEELADGNLWFLHDTVEDRRRHVFASRALGKLPSNSLCLNTHIQALTVLFRFLKHPEAKEAFRGAAEKGLRALQAALNLNGGGRVYKRLMAWIFRTHFEKEAPTRWKIYTQSFRIHATGRIYWPLRQRYPRLVQPSGFIERDLSLAFASHGYHVLNLKDLLVLYDQTRLNWLVPYIEGGMRYLRGLDWDRWMQRDPLFVELPDVLQLYDRLISSVPQNEVHRVEEALNKVKGGVSLDFATQATLAFSKEPRAGQFADAVRSCLGVTG
jgi:hypothetical protein